MKDGTGLAPPTALLMGRKGSKGLPGKNTMRICGRPISHYPILAALNSKYISNIFLSLEKSVILTSVIRVIL